MIPWTVCFSTQVIMPYLGVRCSECGHRTEPERHKFFLPHRFGAVDGRTGVALRVRGSCRS